MLSLSKSRKSATTNQIQAIISQTETERRNKSLVSEWSLKMVSTQCSRHSKLLYKSRKNECLHFSASKKCYPKVVEIWIRRTDIPQLRHSAHYRRRQHVDQCYRRRSNRQFVQMVQVPQQQSRIHVHRTTMLLLPYDRRFSSLKLLDFSMPCFLRYYLA